MYDCIQTVDRISVAHKINVIAKELNKVQEIYLQVNIGNKKEREGFLTNKIIESSLLIKEYKNIKISGVMIIPPLSKNKEEYNNYFKLAKKIQTIIQKKITTCQNLSMGMSNDYMDAIQEGATHIRIGTALFGKRKK